MIRILQTGSVALTTVDISADWALPADAVWLDLLDPTREEELACEKAIGQCLPTREEMEEIEASSRLYRENGAFFLTAPLLINSEGAPTIGPVTFVVSGARLITIRYVKPRAFDLFEAQLKVHHSVCHSGVAVFLGLLEAIIDRLADVLERANAGVEALSSEVLAKPEGLKFKQIMRGLAQSQGINAKVRESAAGLNRLMIFAATADPIQTEHDGSERLDSMQRDLASLIDHTAHLSTTITFLLDAALGMINIEQNAIIKIFSVAAVVFLPPTLVASYFGMNFKHMGIFDNPSGEALAAIAMVVSVIAPLLWFKRKGWL